MASHLNLNRIKATTLWGAFSLNHVALVGTCQALV
jgi:hypothetical protein